VELLEIDPAYPATADSTELHMLFGDPTWPCGSGVAGSGAGSTVVVDESDDAVSVVVLVTPDPASTGQCPTGVMPLTVSLSSPLGTRHVFDGSTEPGRPLTMFGPVQRLHMALAGGSVLGWWDADASSWVDADAMSPALPVAPGTEFTVVSLDGSVSTARSGTVVSDCEPIQTWTISLDPALDSSQGTLAVDASWSVLPRRATELSNTIPDYAGAVSAYLADQGLPDVPVLVDQIIRVDLDGDGTDEVLISARHPEASSAVGAAQGFYSVVLLRRVVGSNVETTALFEDLHTAADNDLPSMRTGQVMAVGDLNGDGTMEVAVQWQYFEGGGVDILDVSSGAPQKVLTTGCGS
ncbi:MAG: hypothetical protein RLZZ623_2511, partial [Actinomycetota bacterium]